MGPDRGKSREELPKEGKICYPEEKSSQKGMSTETEAQRAEVTCLRDQD